MGSPKQITVVCPFCGASTILEYPGGAALTEWCSHVVAVYPAVAKSAVRPSYVDPALKRELATHPVSKKVLYDFLIRMWQDKTHLVKKGKVKKPSLAKGTAGADLDVLYAMAFGTECFYTDDKISVLTAFRREINNLPFRKTYLNLYDYYTIMGVLSGEFKREEINRKVRPAFLFGEFMALDFKKLPHSLLDKLLRVVIRKGMLDDASIIEADLASMEREEKEDLVQEALDFAQPEFKQEIYWALLDEYGEKARDLLFTEYSLKDYIEMLQKCLLEQPPSEEQEPSFWLPPQISESAKRVLNRTDSGRELQNFIERQRQAVFRHPDTAFLKIRRFLEEFFQKMRREKLFEAIKRKHLPRDLQNDFIFVANKCSESVHYQPGEETARRPGIRDLRICLEVLMGVLERLGMDSSEGAE